MKRERKNIMKKGFTLIEIMFSLGVLLLVVGLGISQMSGATEQAAVMDMKADMRTAIIEEEASRI